MISLSGVKASLFGGFFLSLSACYIIFLSPNTRIHHQVYDLEIADSMSLSEVRDILETDDVIRNSISFLAASRALGDSDTIPKGLYQIKKGWNNWSMLQHLKTPPPETAIVIIKPFQKRRNTLQGLCSSLDIKFTALRDWMEDENYVSQWGNFNQENVYCILIPDTLYLYRHSRAKEVADRLFRNYLDFWNPERLQKAASLGLSMQEAGILASIIYAETKKTEEMPLIAGLYLNRLRKEMRLQADPTVVFAHGRPLSRVLKVHKRIKSDYNTYKVAGLPPGPVFSATPAAIDAVLNPASHEYLYFCARNDFSGYHRFSKTLDEHLQVARQYQRELNRRRIGFKGS